MNESPDITIQLGKNTESFFSIDSYQVNQLNKMWTTLAQIGLLWIILSLPLLTKKVEDPAERKSAVDMLDDAI